MTMNQRFNQRFNNSLTRLSEELADATPRRGFLRTLGATVAVLTSLGALERAFGGQGYSVITCPDPCNVAAGCGKINKECGNGGFKCSKVVKTSTDTTDPCCKCKASKDDACPDPLTTGTNEWLSCCLCKET